MRILLSDILHALGSPMPMLSPILTDPGVAVELAAAMLAVIMAESMVLEGIEVIKLMSIFGRELGKDPRGDRQVAVAGEGSC